MVWKISGWRDLRDTTALIVGLIAAVAFAVTRFAGIEELVVNDRTQDSRIEALERNSNAVLFMTCALFDKEYPALEVTECKTRKGR